MSPVLHLRNAFALLLLFASTQLLAANVTFVGQVGYEVLDATTAELTAAKVQNNDTSGVSGALRMELWAYAQPFNGTPQSGAQRMAIRELGQLAGGASIVNIAGAVAFTPPPAGTWYFTLFLTEFTNTGTNDGYTARVYATFPTAVVFGSGTPGFVPLAGTWWNPNESGTGYSIQVRHGVMVMLMYSYKTTGDSEWYYLEGTLTDNGTRLVTTLDKFRNGQCAGCAYPGTPTAAGNDGTVTIQFTSATAGTITFPSGRVVPIQPFVF